MVECDRRRYILELANALILAVREGHRITVAFQKHIAVCKGPTHVQAVPVKADPVAVLSLKFEISQLESQVKQLKEDNDRLYRHLTDVIREDRGLRYSSDTTVYDWLSHEEELEMLRAEQSMCSQTIYQTTAYHRKYMRQMIYHELVGAGQDLSRLRGRIRGSVLGGRKAAMQAGHAAAALHRRRTE